ncbi:hypothetical protein HMPREF7215_2107 [Pyramidobacter piscolens W5455]|uniref:Uncharacterized protein n=1 Tax=Pyramidobacter piscolens W5455 TaxID=352165 RepID=A0ABP2HT99_9BACT|nr:hypothetical protein HMPREF7215_2107 [Pyramidobacter piscolens W5455]
MTGSRNVIREESRPLTFAALQKVPNLCQIRDFDFLRTKVV